jgi:hypothetical protein
MAPIYFTMEDGSKFKVESAINGIFKGFVERDDVTAFPSSSISIRIEVSVILVYFFHDLAEFEFSGLATGLGLVRFGSTMLSPPRQLMYYRSEQETSVVPLNGLLRQSLCKR